jgi:hypothetical protein
MWFFAYQTKVYRGRKFAAITSTQIFHEESQALSVALGAFSALLLYRPIPDTPIKMLRKLHPNSPQHRFASYWKIWVQS